MCLRRLAEQAGEPFRGKCDNAVADLDVKGAVERMMRYIAETGEEDPLVVISGGNAELLAGCLSVRAELVDNLVLEGLAVIGARDV